MLKNEKSANRIEHQNQKTEVFWLKNRKPDQKNIQNRETENPNPSSWLGQTKLSVLDTCKCVSIEQGSTVSVVVSHRL